MVLPETIHKFKFHIIDNESVIKLISLMFCKSTLNVLNMDGKLIRISGDIVLPWLCKIFNISIHSGNVPVDFKVSRVTPMYKNKGSPIDCSNYRPIS